MKMLIHTSGIETPDEPEAWIPRFHGYLRIEKFTLNKNAAEIPLRRYTCIGVIPHTVQHKL